MTTTDDDRTHGGTYPDVERVDMVISQMHNLGYGSHYVDAVRAARDALAAVPSPPADIRDTVDRAIGAVVCNASNFPERVQARILGQNMAPLRTRLTDAVLAALSSPPADAVRDRLVIRHVGGNTLGGTVEQVLSTHLAKGWSVESFRPRAEANPPADDVREALAVVNAAAGSDDVDEALWGVIMNAISGDHSAHSIASAVQAAFEVRLRGTVTEPTVEEWTAQMDAERARQIEHGYDDAHDAEHGIAHLLNWSIDYARRGNTIAAATLARCALRLPRGTVTEPTDAEVEAAAKAMFEDPIQPGDGYTWAQMVAEDPSRADIWRADARRVLNAAGEARS